MLHPEWLKWNKNTISYTLIKLYHQTNKQYWLWFHLILFWIQFGFNNIVFIWIFVLSVSLSLLVAIWIPWLKQNEIHLLSMFYVWLIGLIARSINHIDNCLKYWPAICVVSNHHFNKMDTTYQIGYNLLVVLLWQSDGDDGWLGRTDDIAKTFLKSLQFVWNTNCLPPCL